MDVAGGLLGLASSRMLPDVQVTGGCVDGCVDTTGGRQDLLHTRWVVSRPKQHGADSAYLAADGRAGHGPLVRRFVGRSGPEHQGLGRVGPRRFFHFWR